MLDFLPRWMLPWVVPCALLVGVLVVGFGGDLGAVVLTLTAGLGFPVAIIYVRHRRGLDSPRDGMPVGRMDSWLKDRPRSRPRSQD